MKKKYSILKTSLSLLIVLSAAHTGFGQGDMTRENTVLSGGVLDLGDNIIVYERPPEIETDDADGFGTNKSGKKYYYIPASYEIEKINGKPNIKISPDFLSLRVNILPVWPDKDRILSRLSRGGENILINENHLSKLYFYDILLSTTNNNPDNAISFEKQLPNATDLSEAFTYKLTFKNKADCVAAYNDMLDGSLKLRISVAMRFWNKTGYSFNLNLQDFFNSDAYRDFISPVEGNTIWLYKLQTCRSEIESELKTKIVREGINPILEGDLQRFWQDYFDYKPIIIDFDSLSERSAAHRQLTDFEGLTRYQTDQIRKLAEDAESMSDYDFYKKYHSELKKTLDDSSSKDKDGRGKFGVKDIFNAGGSYNSKSTNKHFSELNKILDDEKKLRKYFKESFHYEMEGNVYKPKGIIATEIIKSKDLLKRNQKQVSIMYTQCFEYKTGSVKF